MMAVAIIILIGTIIAVHVDICAVADGSIWTTHICASIGRARGCSANRCCTRHSPNTNTGRC